MNAPPDAYVAVEGLIGAGKTTLARRLATEWNGRLVLEEFDDNPFLARFYDDPSRYAFSVELSFLAQRYHQLKRTTEQDLFSTCTVADYSLGKSMIFAGVTLPEDEAALFTDLYRIMYADLPKPGLVLYLHLTMERVKERIRSRGRPYEQSIDPTYLERLQDRYLDHLHKTTDQRVLIVDLGKHDLLHDHEAYHALLALLAQEHPAGTSVVGL